MIVHVCRSAPPRIGGLETAVGGLAATQAAGGRRVRIVTLRDPGREGGIPGVEVVRLPRIGPVRYPTAWGLVDAVRGAELVHVHGIDGLLDRLAAWGSRPPLGVSTHGAFFHQARDRGCKALWVRTITRSSLARADRVWFGSEVDRDNLAPAQATGEIVPFGFTPLAIERAPEPGLIVVPGRIDTHKGLDDLIDALPYAPGVRVEIVGPPDRAQLVDELLRRATDRGVADRIRFRGALFAEDYRAAVGRAERVVLPSRFEGFGLTALEMMDAGVPVVLSDIAAYRWHRDHAPLVSFRDPPAAGRALLAPIDPIQVERARQIARSYRWSERIAVWDACYASLLAGRAEPR